jgi:hypothetical protein
MELSIPFLWDLVGVTWSGDGSFVWLAEQVWEAFF